MCGLGGNKDAILLESPRVAIKGIILKFANTKTINYWQKG